MVDAGCAVRVRELLGEGYIEVHHQIGQTMTGLGYHGHIALVVFVKDWLVHEGICECSRAVKYVLDGVVVVELQHVWACAR